MSGTSIVSEWHLVSTRNHHCTICHHIPCLVSAMIGTRGPCWAHDTHVWWLVLWHWAKDVEWMAWTEAIRWKQMERWKEIIWVWGSCLSAWDIHPELVSYNIPPHLNTDCPQSVQPGKEWWKAWGSSDMKQSCWFRKKFKHQHRTISQSKGTINRIKHPTAPSDQMTTKWNIPKHTLWKQYTVAIEKLTRTVPGPGVMDVA